MLGWGLLAFVVLLSGCLAYIGDLVGRRMGKKRLALGRLRPRHTAAIMTALFGMLGAIVAIGALLLVSEPVRKMLFEGDKVRSELFRMQREQSQLRGDVAQLRGDLSRSKTELKSQEGKVAAERLKVTQAQADVKSLTATAKTLRQQAQAVRLQLVAVRSQLAKLRPEYQRLKKDRDRVVAARDYAVGDLLKTQERNLKLEAEIKDKETKANARIKDLQANIDELTKSFSDLQEAFAKQASQNREEMGKLQGQVDDARGALEEAKAELAATKAEAERMGGTALISRTQPLIYSKDDELARIQVRSRLNAAEARANLLAVIAQASTAARGTGAKPSFPGGSEAVIPERLVNNQRLSPEEQLQTFTQRLVNVGHDQVILATAIFNSFQGEPVGLNLRILPNPVVYKKDQIIAETKIDGQLPQDQIVEAISAFLQNELAPKARKDGMIPAIGQATPFGEFNQEELFKLIADIRSRPFTSRVRFVASQETRAGDRLKLDFRVS